MDKENLQGLSVEQLHNLIKSLSSENAQLRSALSFADAVSPSYSLFLLIISSQNRRKMWYMPKTMTTLYENYEALYNNNQALQQENTALRAKYESSPESKH
jgi:cell shape-determining protein MreC